jgi:hypothetical protein
VEYEATDCLARGAHSTRKRPYFGHISILDFTDGLLVVVREVCGFLWSRLVLGLPNFTIATDSCALRRARLFSRLLVLCFFSLAYFLLKPKVQHSTYDDSNTF